MFLAWVFVMSKAGDRYRGIKFGMLGVCFGVVGLVVILFGGPRNAGVVFGWIGWVMVMFGMVLHFKRIFFSAKKKDD